MPILTAPDPGYEHATCWCDTVYVVVPLDDIRAGRTRSCGKKRCRPRAKISA